MHRTREELLHLTIGGILGAIAGAGFATLLRPLFPIPTGAVGWITVHPYPKDWDVAVAALIVAGSFAGALAASRHVPPLSTSPAARPKWIATAAVVFVAVCVLHDRPYAPLDLYHDGEHLSPAFVVRGGGAFHRDVWPVHGIAADGGLDLMVLGEPPSPVRVRRLRTIIGAAVLALTAPIAAEVCATSLGVAGAAFASFCAVGAGLMTLFTYYRLAPLVLVTLALLRYLRTMRMAPLTAAMLVSTTGVLWGLDTGTFALLGTIALVVAIHAARIGRVEWRMIFALFAAALLMAILILQIAGIPLRQFFIDSFVTLPRVAWVTWSLPQPELPRGIDALFWLADTGGRYNVPLVAYGIALAIAARRWRADRTGAARIVVITTFALLLFRSAAGRVDANHVRFALPFFGIVAVALFVEPLILRSRVAGTIIASTLLILVLDVVPNVTGLWTAMLEFPAHHSRHGLVPMSLHSGRNLYVTPDFAGDAAALNAYVASFGPDAEILVAANYEALYYLLERKTPARCLDIMMWSAPSVYSAEMSRVRARPPACVILPGPAEIAIDGLTTRERVPQLMEWIDANYPQRRQFGRFVVATR